MYWNIIFPKYGNTQAVILHWFISITLRTHILLFIFLISEQKKLDCSIKEIRDGLRGKVNSLRELEGDEPSRGTNLSPLTQEEWNGVKQVLGDKY